MVSPLALASLHFTEIYPDQDVWRVDHFEASPGKLQDLVESRTFPTQIEAKEFSDGVKTTTKSKFNFTSIEFGTSPLWTVTQEWNQDWEDKYAEWVGTTFTATFFEENKLATDCADAAYALRWIFARNNGLPAAATLSGSGVFATHLSAKAEWQSLPGHKEWQKDKRFLTALNWLLNMVFTKTLYMDTYPVEINRSTIKPGLINLLGGHTEIFNQVSYHPDELPMGLLSSTMPRAIRVLAARPFLDSWRQSPANGGLLRFRWPTKTKAWAMVPKTAMPFYSIEQYDEKLCEDEPRFAFCIIKKLGMAFSPELIVSKLQEGIVDTVNQRAGVVQDGFNFCQVNDCSPGTNAWEDWSTPTRDARLLATLKAASTTASEVGLSDTFNKWLANTKVAATNNKLTYGQLIQRLESNFVSSDPRDEVESRWASSVEAISRHVQRQVVQVEILRAGMVEKARPCRNNPVSCQDSAKLMQLHSTVEHDYRLRQMISGWWKFCEENSCLEEKSFEERLEKIWFQSPAPWDSIEKRNGNIASKGHLLKARSVLPAGKRFVILNNSRLYDVINRTEMKLGLGLESKLGYDDFTKQIYVLKNYTIQLYDEDFNFTGEFPTGRIISANHELHNIGSGQLLLTNPYTAAQLWILDLNIRQTSGAINFILFNKEATGKNIFLLKGHPNRILSVRDGKINFQEISDFNALGIYKFFELGKGNFLIQAHLHEGTDTTVVYLVSGGVVSEFRNFGTGHLQIERLNSNYLFMELWDNNETKGSLIDNDLNVYFDGQKLEKGKSGETDDHFLFKQTSISTWQGIHLKGKTLRETNAIFKGNYVLMMSLSKEWFSYAEPVSRKYVVANLEGQKLDAHAIRMKANCPSFEYFGSICSGDSSLLTELYIQPGEGTTKYGMASVGSFSGIKMKESLANVIKKEEGFSMPSQETKEASKIATGTGIYMADNVMLWFPKP